MYDELILTNVIKLKKEKENKTSFSTEEKKEKKYIKYSTHLRCIKRRFHTGYKLIMVSTRSKWRFKTHCSKLLARSLPRVL